MGWGGEVAGSLRLECHWLVVGGECEDGIGCLG